VNEDDAKPKVDVEIDVRMAVDERRQVMQAAADSLQGVRQRLDEYSSTFLTGINNCGHSILSEFNLHHMTWYHLRQAL
jgi:hypothetical protein